MSEAKQVQGLMRVDPQLLLTKAVENNASIETLERLVALAKDVREVQAKEAYHTAMAEFQRRCPVIDKSSKANIYTARGSYTYSYAPLDKIMVAIRPLLAELGLTVTWTSREEANHVVARCRVSHLLGYSEDSGDVSMPIPDPQERGGGNPSQRSGSALTYAKRYSLLNVTGITPEDDDDAQSVGAKKPQAPSQPDPKDVTPEAPGDMSERDVLWAKVKELQIAKQWTGAQLVMWAKKNCGCPPDDMTVLNLQALKMHLESS